MRKYTISAKFLVNNPKLNGNYAFPQNFRTRKLVEISIFYAVVHAYALNKNLLTSIGNQIVKFKGPLASLWIGFLL